VKTGSCRIIGGKWRGRKIVFDNAEGLRPTTDRIRETVFNWLHPYLYQSHCLDCFAGSGALGFEALSRGASDVIFLDNNQRTVSKLKQNREKLAATGGRIYREDALSWLQSARSEPRTRQAFDLIFLDPPFHSNLLEKSSVLLANSDILSDHAIIYLEHAVDADVELPNNWFCLKQKTAGQVAYKLFEQHVVQGDTQTMPAPQA